MPHIFDDNDTFDYDFYKVSEDFQNMVDEYNTLNN